MLKLGKNKQKTKTQKLFNTAQHSSYACMIWYSKVPAQWSNQACYIHHLCCAFLWFSWFAQLPFTQWTHKFKSLFLPGAVQRVIEPNLAVWSAKVWSDADACKQSCVRNFLALASLGQWWVCSHVVSSCKRFHHSAANRGKNIVVWFWLREIPSMSRPLFGSYPTVTELSPCSVATRTHIRIPNVYLGVLIIQLIGECV